jgi:peptidoglycan/LPS O-acetylase OafA/YrhL
VVVFFLVSGYIITQVLGRESPRVFLVRRFFRIYPLYIGAVLLQVLMEAAIGVPFRGIGVLAGQLSLFGDLFATPHALAGVEWTLRVEVLFYLLMAVLKAGGFVAGPRGGALPWLLAGLALGLFLMPRVPGHWAWCYAYLNLYGPFLLLGAFFALLQDGRTTPLATVAMFGLVLGGYQYLLPRLQPPTSHSPFALYGVLVFVLLWSLRERLRIGRTALWLSDATYPVYLFHNWLYLPLLGGWARVLPGAWLRHAATLATLLGFCMLCVWWVERPAIRLGRRLSARPAPPAPATAAAAGGA